MKTCKGCGIKFVSSVRLLFHDKQCGIDFYRKKGNERESKEYKLDKAIKFERRICLGLRCQGLKKFWSRSKFNRVCDECAGLTRNMEI